ncbi:PBSX family phage terminase large subunit [Siminovitchia sp. FSL W7-1587]|uniref:PBSX family phage terminase large subunit n=1 Tax=Siminovitchia sp. FSL W7-1587 TaxID=2954699 RepID=UPI0030D30E69
MIYKRCVNDDWFMLINHGAKRTGKTILNNDLFLQELIRVKEIASSQDIEKPMYIVSGATLGTIQNNILTEITNKYGIQFTFDKHNNFTLFGVYCVQAGHSTIAHLEKIRGMTAFGAYINEASLANEQVFDEIKSRCSGEGARILVDTNPDNPEHWLLKDYIQSDAPGIISYSFQLDDNTFLSERYRKNIIETTPSGMFTDRNIYGKWVSGDGVVYADFNKEKHAVTKEDLAKIKMVRYFCGVDWGYEHFGSIVVVGVDAAGNYYVIEEHAHQHLDVEKDWVPIAKKIVAKYGNIPFYCDSARPEYVVKFTKNKLNAINANKKVMLGIESVATLIKSNKFYVNYDEMPRFREEIYKYVWHKTLDEPVKEFDDVLDSIRYAVLSDITLSNRTPKKEKYKALQLLGL